MFNINIPTCIKPKFMDSQIYIDQIINSTYKFVDPDFMNLNQLYNNNRDNNNITFKISNPKVNNNSNHTASTSTNNVTTSNSRSKYTYTLYVYPFTSF